MPSWSLFLAENGEAEEEKQRWCAPTYRVIVHSSSVSLLFVLPFGQVSSEDLTQLELAQYSQGSSEGWINASLPGPWVWIWVGIMGLSVPILMSCLTRVSVPAEGSPCLFFQGPDNREELQDSLPCLCRPVKKRVFIMNQIEWAKWFCSLVCINICFHAVRLNYKYLPNVCLVYLKQPWQ